MELRQILYFIAMVEEGSVTQAARRLNIVQPAISQQLSKLEAELGQKLFHRIPKGVVPTEAGHEAYRLLRPIVQNLEFARQQLSIQKGAVKGHLSIGVVSSITNNTLPDTLLAFSSAYPDVTIRATGGYTPDLLDMLKNAQLDMAIVNSPPKAGGFDQVEILQENFALICATEQAGRFQDPIRLDDLDLGKLVLPSLRHGLRGIIESECAAHQVRLRPHLEIDEIKVMEDFVRSSDFVTLLPPIAVNRSLIEGSLVSFGVHPRITRRIVCATSPSRPLSEPAKLFIDTLRATTTATLNKLQMNTSEFHKIS